MKKRDSEQYKVDEYYKKQEQIEKHKLIIQKQHEANLAKARETEHLKEEMFNNIRKSKEDMDRTKLEQTLKKSEQVETKVNNIVFIFIETHSL